MTHIAFLLLPHGNVAEYLTGPEQPNKASLTQNGWIKPQKYSANHSEDHIYHLWGLPFGHTFPLHFLASK